MESRPKLLSFKENDSGTTKLETRVRISVFGSGYCIEDNVWNLRKIIVVCF